MTQSDLEKDPGHSATKDQTCIDTDSDNGPNQPESADFFLKGPDFLQTQTVTSPSDKTSKDQ